MAHYQISNSLSVDGDKAVVFAHSPNGALYRAELNEVEGVQGLWIDNKGNLVYLGIVSEHKTVFIISEDVPALCADFFPGIHADDLLTHVETLLGDFLTVGVEVAEDA